MTMETKSGAREKIANFKIDGNNWELPTEIRLLDLAERTLTRKLKNAGWEINDEISNFVEVAFHEAVINAIGHGNLGIPTGTKNIGRVILDKQRESPTDKKVYINIQIEEDRVTITVRDEGEGFEYEKVQDPNSEENRNKTMGRGIEMIEGVSDSTTYSKGGREVTLVKVRKNKK